ncbi:MAG TPA: hypothetical protein VFA37_02240 [Gaiellaceae bacterium]|nr:hypothetical protein [Gaiellaceae bacterium]
MTLVHSSGVGSSVCAGMKGEFRVSAWCTAAKLRGGRYQAWILTTAFDQGDRYSVPARFARGHPGPAVVTDQWLRLASPRQAQRLLREPDFDKSYTGRPVAAVNGGVARRLPPLAYPDQTEIEFYWASGATVVNVNVIGAHLTVGEAQRIARLARPR